MWNSNYITMCYNWPIKVQSVWKKKPSEISNLAKSWNLAKKNPILSIHQVQVGLYFLFFFFFMTNIYSNFKLLIVYFQNLVSLNFRYAIRSKTSCTAVLKTWRRFDFYWTNFVWYDWNISRTLSSAAVGDYVNNTPFRSAFQASVGSPHNRSVSIAELLAPQPRRSSHAQDKPHKCPEPGCNCSYYSIYHLHRHQRHKQHGEAPPRQWTWYARDTKDQDMSQDNDDTDDGGGT